MFLALFQELTTWLRQWTVTHSHEGQRKKVLDGALDAGQAQLTKTLKAVVRTCESLEVR